MARRKTKAIIDDLSADRKHAQLLIHGYPAGQTYDDLKHLIESAGTRIVKMEMLPSENVLLMLDTDDMRETVLELTEQGYLVDGINALR